ncbi:SufE family protein [Candidatus Neptunochlamydia vexilliferae]|uniref:Cysteine desulfuration protein SufE n=1 Tax=Candidatus Neptunichlamydia vexilliferae TaxID=1651774 RepID=A0ABS0AYH5_9BACT|nr:SufE family protein [Candidatus Neptunochlamydia vexilliferae]MBF5059019.1 Cysteine desulfuration protein SufE [Candidatus Neptunochlamydia vexilliferae]
MSTQSCLEKQAELKKVFSTLKSWEERYNHVIKMGRSLPPIAKEDQIEENRVKGCQSTLYLKVSCVDGRLKLQASSDALISAGLASLITYVYNGELPRAVLECPPLFLKEIALLDALSPGRAIGLKSLYQKLQQECLKWL